MAAMRSIHLCAVMTSLLACGTIYGQYREFAFGLGYGHLFLDGHNSDALEEQGGFRLLGRVSWPVTEPMAARVPELRLGLGLGLSFYISEQGGDIEEVGNVIIITPDDWTQLTVIEPEVQFSVRQPVARDYYLEPGIAGVFTIGNYIRGEEVFGFVDDDIDRWRVGGGGRLFLRGGYFRERYSFGIEGSYSYGWLDFGDDIGGDIQQGYLGLFYAQRF
jgi:hypothetical protein